MPRHNERIRVLTVKPNDARFMRTFGGYMTVAELTEKAAASNDGDAY